MNQCSACGQQNIQPRLGFPPPPSVPSLPSLPSLPPLQFQANTSLPGGQWKCRTCTLINDSNDNSCQACGKPRSHRHGTIQPPAPPPGGDGGLTPFMRNFGHWYNNGIVYGSDSDETKDNSNNSNSNNTNNIVSAIEPRRDVYGNIISSQTEFENACCDILANNMNPNGLFKTLISISRKLMKEEARFHRLDLQNPKVIEHLIGYECVIDFLVLLGFKSNRHGTMLVCEPPPRVDVIKSAIAALKSYENRLTFNRKNISADVDIDNDSDNEEMSLAKIIEFCTNECLRNNENIGIIISTIIVTHVEYTDSLYAIHSFCLFVCFWHAFFVLFVFYLELIVFV